MSLFAPEIIMNEVVSGNIAKIGWLYDINEPHEKATGILEVEFKNGSRYRYRDIPHEIYRNMQNSDSIGSFLAKEIKGKYECFKFEENSENIAGL